MAGRGDRQELGQSLDDPQQQGLEFDIGAACYVARLRRGATPVWNQAKTKQPMPTTAAASPCLKWT